MLSLLCEKVYTGSLAFHQLFTGSLTRWPIGATGILIVSISGPLHSCHAYWILAHWFSGFLAFWYWSCSAAFPTSLLLALLLCRMINESIGTVFTLNFDVLKEKRWLSTHSFLPLLTVYGICWLNTIAIGLQFQSSHILNQRPLLTLLHLCVFKNIATMQENLNHIGLATAENCFAQ